MEWNSQEEWKEVQERLEKGVIQLYDAAVSVKKEMEILMQAIAKALSEAFGEAIKAIKKIANEIFKYEEEARQETKLKRHKAPPRINMKNFIIIRKPDIRIRNTC